MNASTDRVKFCKEDDTYHQQLRDARVLDPVAFADSDLAAQLREEPDAPLSKASASRFAEECKEALQTADPSIEVAVRRDLDKLFGAYAYHKAPLPDDVAKFFHDERYPRPRANLYEYVLGSDTSVVGHLYTGDQREINLMGILEESLACANTALKQLLVARENLRSGGDSGGALQEAEQAIKATARPMIRTYRDVTPEFFNLSMTRRWRGIEINGRITEGPNVSHNVHMLVDRFAGGSFSSIIANNPHMAGAYEHRLSSMPQHQKDLLYEADELGDDSSVLELATVAKSDPDIESARVILASLRKTKVMHKSYADKGLVARGKKLSPDMPNILTPNIDFMRRAEQAP